MSAFIQAINWEQMITSIGQTLLMTLLPLYLIPADSSIFLVSESKFFLILSLHDTTYGV